MALKVKATEQLIKIGKYEGKYRYVMMPERHVGMLQVRLSRRGPPKATR